MKEDQKRQNLSIGAVLFAGVFWGIISIFVKQLSKASMNSFQIMLLRAWLSTALLFVYFIIRNPKLLKIQLRDIWMFIGTGIISLTFFSWCYFTTIAKSGASVAVVLLYTSPVFVMLFSAVLFHEKITGKKIISLLVTFLGCILVAGVIKGGHSLKPLSFLIGLGSGFGYGLYSIFARLALRKYSTLTVTFYTFLLSGVSMLALCNPCYVISAMDLRTWKNALAIALVCTVIPYLLYTYGLSKMEAGKAAVLVTVEPLVGTVLGIFAYHEDHGISKVLGILLIFSAIVLLSVQPARVTKKKNNHL